MSNSEASFYGTGSLSPTTDDIRSYSKRGDPRFEEKSLSEGISKGGQRSQSAERGKKPHDVSIKVNKGIQFTVQKVPSGRTLTAKTIARRSCYVLLGIVIALVVVAFFVMFVIIPLVFSTNLAMRRHLMFVGWVRRAPSELQNPSVIGLPCSIYLPINNEGTVASWYIPAEGKEPCGRSKPFEVNRPVVLFVPSFEEARSNPNTVAMLKVISQNLTCHVLAFDYKGTADSGDVLPSTETVVSDANRAYSAMVAMMNEVQNRNAVIIWGNTWGAPVALQLAGGLAKNSPLKHYMVLQSPVENTLKAAGTALSFNVPWRWTPFFTKAFVEPLQRNKETNVDTVKIIGTSTLLPTLVIHAADDDIVDISQGRTIFKALQSVKDKIEQDIPVQMLDIPESENVGHLVATARDLVTTVSGFIGATATTIARSTRQVISSTKGSSKRSTSPPTMTEAGLTSLTITEVVTNTTLEMSGYPSSNHLTLSLE